MKGVGALGNHCDVADQNGICETLLDPWRQRMVIRGIQIAQLTRRVFPRNGRGQLGQRNQMDAVAIRLKRPRNRIGHQDDPHGNVGEMRPPRPDKIGHTFGVLIQRGNPDDRVEKHPGGYTLYLFTYTYSIPFNWVGDGGDRVGDGYGYLPK